ncbi:MAG: PAS domain-containing protein [Candidatus Stahlbacteria bacterium]|nr:MAG: PAS domain-containing protein [Candidatus Stahlbacteria bacterium]
MEVTIFVIASLAAFVVNLSMAIFVYLKNRKVARNKLFSLLCVMIGTWCLYPTIMASNLDAHSMLFLIRIIYLFAIFCPSIYLHFILELLGEAKRKKHILFPCYLFSLTFVSLGFRDWFIAGITSSNVYKYIIVPGPLYTVYVSVFAAMIIYGFYVLLDKYKIWSGFKKNQCKYLFIGFLLAFTGGLMHFLSAFGIEEKIPHDIFLVMFTSITAYSIVKYRLMDIRIVFRTVMTYSLMTAFVTLFFILVIYLPNLLFGPINRMSSFFLMGIISFGFALLFNPLRNRIENIFVNLFHPERESYYRELRKHTRELSTILEIEVLLNFIIEKVVRTLGSSLGYLYVLNENSGIYECKVTLPKEDHLQKSPDSKNILVTTLQERKNVLLEEDLALLPSRVQDAIQSIFNKLRIKLVLPLSFRDQMVGFLCLGGKLSGDIYTNLDIQLLSLFSDEASIALENAKLFQQVKNMKDYNEGILQGMRSGVISLDGNGRISAFNSQAERITGLSRKYIIGKEYSVLPIPLNKVFESGYKGGKSYADQEFSIEVNKGQGKRIPAMINTSVLYEETGSEIRQVICVLTDLTKLKELEAEVRKAERLATMGLIAGELAHEIKNPLVSIRTLAQLLPDKYGDEEFRNEFMTLALKEIDRIDEMVNKLFNLTLKKEKGEYVKVSLSDLLEEILEDMSIQLSAKRIQIIKKYLSQPNVFADRVELKKAFSNIITNCAEAVDEKGKIYIDIVQKKNIRLPNVVTFKDDGPGFSERSIERAFDAFYTTKQKGSGLGLFVAYRVIRNHDGRIHIGNWERGAMVTVELPFYSQDHPDKSKKVH